MSKALKVYTDWSERCLDFFKCFTEERVTSAQEVAFLSARVCLFVSLSEVNYGGGRWMDFHEIWS